jgi:HSP20 family protein
MKIIRRDPFKEIERFFDDPDFFGVVPAFRRNMLPPMDVYQTEKDLIIELQVPKINKDKVEISVEDGILKIEGKDEETVVQDEKEYYRKEIRSGSFLRMISLPVAVKEQEAEAKYEDGILKIAIPKVEASKPKKVEVKIK